MDAPRSSPSRHCAPGATSSIGKAGPGRRDLAQGSRVTEIFRRPATALLAALAASGLLVALLAMQASNAGAITNCSVADQSIDAEEIAFVTLMNDYRVQKGLQPLSISKNLNRAASWMAADMAGKNYFSHTDSLGRAPQPRITDCGYPGNGGENIAAGTTRSTGSSVFVAWVASVGHNENLLNAIYVQVGVARAYNASSAYGWYWVANFGTVDDGTGILPNKTVTATITKTVTATITKTVTVTPTKTVTAVPVKVGSVALKPGANLITWGGKDSTLAEGLKDGGQTVVVIYKYDPKSGGWLKYGPDLPGYMNNLGEVKQGEAYWVIVKSGIELQFTK
jgi:uncharacterized protein YkwD